MIIRLDLFPEALSTPVNGVFQPFQDLRTCRGDESDTLAGEVTLYERLKVDQVKTGG